MRISAFNFSISNISAVRMVRGEKVNGVLGIGDIPNTIHPLLQQTVISQKDLAPFERIRKQVQEFLRMHGAWHELLGWVVSDSELERNEVIRYMEEASEKFYAEKRSLLNNYETRCVEHLERIKDECEKTDFGHCEVLIEMLRKAQPKLEYLDTHIQFRFLKPRVVEIHEDDEKEQVIDGLYGQALTEIQARAKRAVDAPRVKTQITAAESIACKCESLSYIDSRYNGVATEIRKIIGVIPLRESDSSYLPVERLSLLGMMSILSDANKLDEKIRLDGGLFPVAEDDQINLFTQDDEVETDTDTHIVPQSPIEAPRHVYSW